MKKGDFVKLVICRDIDLTAGKLYEVKAAAGDIDTVCGGIVRDGDFISTTDSGFDFYSRMDGDFGKWELQ